MSTDILRIIEGGLANDKRKIINYAIRLAERLKADGDVQLSKCIVEQIESSTHKNVATADAMRMVPLDMDKKSTPFGVNYPTIRWIIVICV